MRCKRIDQVWLSEVRLLFPHNTRVPYFTSFDPPNPAQLLRSLLEHYTLLRVIDPVGHLHALYEP